MKNIIFLLLISFSSFAQKGITGQAVNGRCVKVPTMTGATFQSNGTLQIWVKPPVNISDNEAIFSTNTTNVATNHVSIGYKLVGAYTFFNVNIWNNAGTLIFSSFIKRSTLDQFKNGYENARYLITITWSFDGTKYTYKSYLNGDLVTTVANVATKPNVYPQFTFFQDKGAAVRVGDSQISKAKLYSTALTAVQVDSAYKGFPQSSNLVFNIPFDSVYQSGGNYYSADISGNGNNAQLISFVNPLTSVTTFADGNESTKTMVMFAGNSMITAGAYGFVDELIKVQPSNWWIIDEAVGGTDTHDMLVRFPTTVAPFVRPTWGHNYIIAWEYINAVKHGLTEDTIRAQLTRYNSMSLSAGFEKVVNITALPSCSITVDSVRINHNLWLGATFPYVMDACADTLFGYPGAYTNGYYDGCIHLSGQLNGNKYMADDVKAYILNVLPLRTGNSSTYTPDNLSVYPNPSRDNVNIHADGLITIYNSIGESVYTGKSGTVSLSNGIYLIKSGNTTKKLIIE